MTIIYVKNVDIRSKYGMPAYRRSNTNEKKIEWLRQELKDTESSRDWWRELYLHECELQDAWMEKHKAIIKKLTSELEDNLFELYRFFEIK